MKRLVEKNLQLVWIIVEKLFGQVIMIFKLLILRLQLVFLYLPYNIEEIILF